MDLGEFTILLFLNIDIYIFYLIVAFLFYFFFYNKYFKGLLDPFFFFFILVFAFCTANIFFLFHLNEIRFYYFSNYILCQILFFIGYKSFQPFRKLLENDVLIKKRFDDVENDHSIYIYFAVSLVLFFILQPSVYIFSGIPLLMKSRWQTFDNSGGLGLIDRLLDVFRFVLSFSTLWLLFSGKKKGFFFSTVLYFSLIGLLVTSVLNGSKMAILDYVYILAFVSFAKQAQGYLISNISRVRNTLLLLSILGAFFAIIIHYQVNDVEYSIFANDYTNPLFAFLLRFIYSGDVYIMAYPNDTINMIEWYNPFIALFRNIIGMLRIVPWEEIPKDVGFSIYSIYDDSDIPRGPTMKFDIFSLFFVGFVGSMIFSYLTGYLLSLYQNKKFEIGKKFSFYLNHFLVLYYLFLLPINPPVAFSKLFNVVLFFFLPRFFIKSALKNVRSL